MIEEIDIEQKALDAEYRQKVITGRAHEYECVITIKGRSAYEMMCCGASDVKYLLDEGDLHIQQRDVKSVKFYDKTEEKQRTLTIPHKKLIGSGAFDGCF